jgi:signal transduction histidine kinase
MRWPIRLQIFLPFAALLAIAVATGAVTSAVLSARRTGAAEMEQLTRVVQALDAANFPYTASVLDRMRGLSGAEFVVVDASGRVTASTLPGGVVLPEFGDPPALVGSTLSLSGFPSVEIEGRRFFVAAVDAPQSGMPRRLYVLFPQAAWEQRRWEAAWPPLAIGGVTLLLMLLVSGWLADRFGRRIAAVRDLFSGLEAGRHPRLRPPTLRDELATLIESANELSARLEELQGEIARTERLRVLAQLAGGFAHQLRNAVTGARLAVQLHQWRCGLEAEPEDSLAVALAQLRLTEQQVQGLLSLSRDPWQTPRSGDLSAVLREVVQLVGPNVEHRHVRFVFREDLGSPYPLTNRDSMLGALLNLVLNALEAAGIGGEVELSCQDEGSGGVRIVVTDNGAGPPAALQPRLGEPFVTGKPEGVGLGLALAQQAAHEQGGDLSWFRAEGRTHFVVALPPQGDAPALEHAAAMAPGAGRTPEKPQPAALSTAGGEHS